LQYGPGNHPQLDFCGAAKEGEGAAVEKFRHQRGRRAAAGTGINAPALGVE